MTISLVTGSSTGIGLATALSLARGGHKVFGTMRNPDRAPELARTAASEGLDVTVLPMDVDDDASVTRAIGEALRRSGRIDALVNNAGVWEGGPVEEASLASFRRVMETNFFGMVRCTKAVLPVMREQGAGSIVNVTSISGRITGAANAPYAASKFAAEAFSEALAQEMATFSVRVAIVEPGVIATPIFDKMQTSPKDSRYPHGRRLRALFRTSLKRPVPPSLVGDQILAIIDSGSPHLRHPVGPDAAPYLEWRAAVSDEDFAAMGALSDQQWSDYVRNTFGMVVEL